jgi:hypothetical protein
VAEAKKNATELNFMIPNVCRGCKCSEMNVAKE